MAKLDLDIVAFPSVVWNHNWERQHEFITRLARNTSKQLEIVGPLGMVNYGPLGVLKRLQQLRARDNSHSNVQNPTEGNMRFTSPKLIPYHYTRFTDSINLSALKKAVQLPVRESIGYFTYVNGSSLRLMKEFKLSILDLAQRRQVSTELPQGLKKAEREAVRAADIVITDNQATLGDYEKDRDSITYLPQGVNLEAFKADGVHPELVERAKGYKGVIGYIGTDKALDYAWMRELVQAMPDYYFPIVGELHYKNADAVLRFPNVSMVGRVPHRELASYLAGFDIGLIPYTIDSFTDGVFPTKAFEYLASYTPVVSTPLKELKAYQSNVLTLCLTPKKAKEVILRMFENPQADEHFIKALENQTWNDRFDVLMNLIEQKLN